MAYLSIYFFEGALRPLGALGAKVLKVLRVLKFDGPSGPEGCGGGSAAVYSLLPQEGGGAVRRRRIGASVFFSYFFRTYPQGYRPAPSWGRSLRYGIYFCVASAA